MSKTESLLLVSEDCPVKRGTTPESRKPDAIVMIEYDELVKNPHKYTSDEFIYQVHVVRRKKKENELKKDSYNMIYSQLCKKWGWGIHFDMNGKLALVGCETPKYKQLMNDSNVEKKKAFRNYRK